MLKLLYAYVLFSSYCDQSMSHQVPCAKRGPMMWVGPAKQLDGALIPLYIGLLYKVLNNTKVLNKT